MERPYLKGLEEQNSLCLALKRPQRWHQESPPQGRAFHNQGATTEKALSLATTCFTLLVDTPRAGHVKWVLRNMEQEVASQDLSAGRKKVFVVVIMFRAKY